MEPLDMVVDSNRVVAFDGRVLEIFGGLSVGDSACISLLPKMVEVRVNDRG
jgi:hypothetical protein